MRRTLVVLATLATFSLPLPARALDCAWGPIHTSPENQSEQVPTNAVIRVVYLYATIDDVPLSLYDPHDEPVPSDIDLVSDGGAGERVYTLTPAEPLDAATTYRLFADPDPDLQRPLSSFTTGDGPWTVAPSTPRVIDTSRDFGRNMWGSSRFHRLTVEAPEEPMFYEVDVASDPDFADERTVQVPGLRAEEGLSIRIGTGLCGGNLPIERQDRWLRARAIDLAGNISGSSDVARVGGCSSIPAPLSALGALAVLGLLGLRRRRA